MKSSRKLSIGQVEDLEKFLHAPTEIPLTIIENGVCFEMMESLVGRIIFDGTTNEGFCILCTLEDVNKEIIYTNYSQTPQTVAASSTEIYPSVNTGDITPITQIPPESWVTLRVMELQNEPYFLVVQSGTLLTL